MFNAGVTPAASPESGVSAGAESSPSAKSLGKEGMEVKTLESLRALESIWISTRPSSASCQFSSVGLSEMVKSVNPQDAMALA
jgi:hypothetical protein